MTEADQKLVDKLYKALSSPDECARPVVDTLTRNELERLVARLKEQAASGGKRDTVPMHRDH
jgi:hypothetical protein